MVADAPEGVRMFAPVHRILDRLSAVKLRVGVLRRRLRRGQPLDPAEAEAHLAEVDRDVDAAAELIAELRDREPSAP